jgi:soluble lytic murein transglycosylase-like protein
MPAVRRALRRWVRRQPLWSKALVLGAGALCAFNLAVGFFGNSRVFPLSPYFLKEKAQALGHYARHRPACLWRGHGDLAALVEEASARHGLPPGLLAALVQVESGGQAHRISPAGAMGPGQLMPGTARQLRVKDPFDPAPAIDGSARYLAQQLRRHKGDVPLALAAYNAGPGAVRDRVPQNGETEHYVRKVLALTSAGPARQAPRPR